MIKTFFKGLAMGSADAVPGVSGGTIAFITGIYDRLIGLISMVGPELWGRYRRDGLPGVIKAADLNFSLPLLAGIGAGILLVSKSVLLALEYYPALIWSVFLGLVLAAVPMVLRGVAVKSHWIWLAMGFAVAAGIGGFSLRLPTELWGIMLGGFIALSAMILPGISGSFLLLLFGLYEPVFGAIHELNWPIIVAFAAGGILGLASMARILNWAFKKKPAQVRSALVGLMLGSSIQLWPFNHAPAEGMNLVWAVIGVIVGGGVLWALERLAR